MARAKLAPDLKESIGHRILMVQLTEKGFTFGPPLLGKLKHLSRTLGVPIETLIDFCYQVTEDLLDQTFKGVDEQKK